MFLLPLLCLARADARPMSADAEFTAPLQEAEKTAVNGAQAGKSAATAAPIARRAGAAAPSFKRVMIVMFENTDYDVALQQPFFATFAEQGALLTHYLAVTHPSQPNYIALTSGQAIDCEGTDDCDSPHDLDRRHIGDLLEAKGKSWKVYAEGYPGGCFLKRKSGRYVRRHVPFLSYVNVQNDPARCARIVDASQLDADIASGSLPDFAMYIPDLDDDGHDTSAKVADAWFARAFGPRLKDPRFARGMLLVATFDENDNESMPNQVYTALWGDSVVPGMQTASSYNHYSLLRTVEVGLGIGTLGVNDMSAEPITGVWK